MNHTHWALVVLIVAFCIALAGCGPSENRPGSSNVYSYPQDHGVICYGRVDGGAFSCVKVTP